MSSDHYWLLPSRTNPVSPDGLPAFIPGPHRYSPVAAIRDEIDRLLEQLESELKPFRDSRPECRYLRVSGPWLGRLPASGPLPDCQRNHPSCVKWAASVRGWHDARFGIGHDDLTFARLAQPADTYRHRQIAPLAFPNVTVVASRVEKSGSRPVYAFEIDASATIDDIKATAAKVGTALRRAGVIARGTGRASHLDRPARAAYWLVQKMDGLSGNAIADGWAASTRSWVGDAKAKPVIPAISPGPTELIRPAFLEWSSLQFRNPTRSHMHGIETPSAQVVYDAIKRFRRFAAR